MTNRSSLSFPAKTIGLDLGDRTASFTIRDGAGEIIERGKVAMMKTACREFFAQHPEARVVYEAGTHSLWLTWLLREMGNETVVANPWRLKLISQSLSKNDSRDADLLSDFGFLKPSTLSPITHRGPEGYGARALLSARAALVEVRAKLINCTRGILKAVGARAPNSSSASFHKKLWVPESLFPALAPIRDQIEELSLKIRDYDQQVEKISNEQFPETRRGCRCSRRMRLSLQSASARVIRHTLLQRVTGKCLADADARGGCV